jgi:adenylosuccinate synthase
MSSDSDSNLHSIAQDIGTHFQEVGKKFGTTTGCRRRCGCLDLVVMKHSTMINGYSCLNLTKLDVLDDLGEIKVAVKYLVDGKELASFPGGFSRPGTGRSLV